MVANLLPSDGKLSRQNSADLLATAVLYAWCQWGKLEIDIAEKQSRYQIIENKDVLEALEMLTDSLRKKVIESIIEKDIDSLDSSCCLKEATDKEISFFNNIGLGILSNLDDKALGAVFTPSWLSEYVTKTALTYWQEINDSSAIPSQVADFSCGSGSFLIQLSQFLNGKSHIYGKDISSELGCLARLSTLGINNATVSVGDSLLDHLSINNSLFDYHEGLSAPKFKKKVFESYDIVVGNPPYVRSQNISSQYADMLKKAYPGYTSGNFDLVTLFLVQSLEALKPGGVASLVVSNKFMNSKYGASVCRLLANHSRVIEVVNFGDNQVFPGKTTYTCIVTFSKQPKAKLFRIINFPSGTKLTENKLAIASEQINELSVEQLLWHPWDLSVGTEKQILNTIRQNSKTLLTDEFLICQGIRTGMNQAYVLSQEELSRTEPEITFPFVSGRNIRRCAMLPAQEFVVFPYQFNEFNTAQVIPPSLMQEKYPKTWKYLQQHKVALSSRSLDKALPWYAFSRNQNLEQQTRPKILVKEMMSRAEFFADYEGEYRMGSGYALVAPQNMSSKVLQMWSAVLSTPTMEFQLRSVGTQLHSGWFRLLKHHLKCIQLPEFSPSEQEYAVEISSRIYKNPEEDKDLFLLDELVANSFRLTELMRQHIKQYLANIHDISRSSSKSNDIKPEASKPVTTTTETTAYPDLTPEQRALYLPVELPQFNKLHIERKDFLHLVTFKPNKRSPIHRWYNFTQGYSGKLVECLLKELEISSSALVCDPFAGSGTTLLSCKKSGFASIGFEISPLMVWIAKQKIRNWNIGELRDAVSKLSSEKVRLANDSNLLFQDYFNKAYAPEILRQIIGWRNWIWNSDLDGQQKDFLTLALLCILEEVSLIRKHGSHYRFLNKADSVGLEKLNTPTIASDANIQPILIRQVEEMIGDVESTVWEKAITNCEVYCGNSLSLIKELPDIDVVITSPPYLNRNNYIAQQKAEISLLELLPSYEAYRDLVKRTFRSHVESDLPSKLETSIEEVEKIVHSLELTENNNPKIPYMIAGYFEDLKLTLKALSQKVKPGGYAVFVVGNSRWGGVVVPVDHLLALLAEHSGFYVKQILVTRMKGNSPQQMKRYGRIPVRESIVILQKL
ncbi:N-6 DNA methylase [Oculatella sp. LEGE 06141]|uniref:Eco57I restriction-modification methylase domain-containing protein n=1 Tax=Oculatella sp. LEGE 06141 TaxID=1828648 RepID=UPI00187FCD8C|nr:N-6 DNA methylase [Oculatella sp. LEGE 06141]MBE9183080.1 N-6 DNA methylase [Oculatella sp. LEGE 06141]